MANRRWNLMALALVVLVVSALACGPKSTPVPQVPPPTVTPYIPATTPPQDTQSSPPPPPPQTPGTPPETTPSPESPGPADTDTPTPTNTVPPPPPATPKPTDTPTQPAPGAPLVITDQGYQIEDWQKLGGGQWEAHLRVTFTGGVAPYTFAIEHSTPQSENYLTLNSAKECGGEPVRVDVWSADGQHVYKNIWVVLPWCPP